MKRILTGVALATTAALATATPAMAAAPKNPVVAVKKTFTAGKGVKFTERTTVAVDGDRQIFTRRSGTLQAGKSGIAASDITAKMNITSKDLDQIEDVLGDSELGEMMRAIAKPEHTIRVGSTAYMSGNMWSVLLPEGQTWFKAPNGPAGGVMGMYGQPINAAETGTLKTLLKGAKPTSNGYAGKVSVNALWKASPWLQSSWRGMVNPKSKVSISWRLTVDKKGLPTRLVSTYPMSLLIGEGGQGTLSVDTTYSGWGSKVSIKAPTTSVADKMADGETEIPRLQIPLGSLAD
ncbi:hypothetical protein SAMN05421874_118141 [Nonomuraea maritima]|uniref:Uncharacterized protein n=1 Tax=Nonomuraea maritima TaxID=683260 RepID=A0A1G9IQ69_9ACTN|nr:hypothetical protein [Nonomuraea maritima]SDL27205.1 hypothetical protein SAMN05421874_118141 [Nonomuraea maritima]